MGQVVPVGPRDTTRDWRRSSPRRTLIHVLNRPSTHTPKTRPNVGCWGGSRCRALRPFRASCEKLLADVQAVVSSTRVFGTWAEARWGAVGVRAVRAEQPWR